MAARPDRRLRRAAAVAWLAGAVGLAGSQAHADSFRMQPLKSGAPVSIQGYGQQNPDCLEWTNGCVLCVMTGGHAQCSTPGIACTPAGLTCKRRAK